MEQIDSQKRLIEDIVVRREENIEHFHYIGERTGIMRRKLVHEHGSRLPLDKLPELLMAIQTAEQIPSLHEFQERLLYCTQEGDITTYKLFDRWGDETYSLTAESLDHLRQYANGKESKWNLIW